MQNKSLPQRVFIKAAQHHVVAINQNRDLSVLSSFFFVQLSLHINFSHLLYLLSPSSSSPSNSSAITTPAVSHGW